MSDDITARARAALEGVTRGPWVRASMSNDIWADDEKLTKTIDQED